MLSITDNHADYAAQVAETLREQGLRVQADLRNEKIGYKIREHTLQRVPYLLVVGERECANSTVAVRTRSGEDKGSLPLAEVAATLVAEAANRGHCVTEC